MPGLQRSFTLSKTRRFRAGVSRLNPEIKQGLDVREAVTEREGLLPPLFLSESAVTTTYPGTSDVTLRSDLRSGTSPADAAGG